MSSAVIVDTGPLVATVDRDDAHYQRSGELVARYADLDLGFVDASVVAVAERLGISTVVTVNHRDFRIVRPAHVVAFTLVP